MREVGNECKVQMDENESTVTLYMRIKIGRLVSPWDGPFTLKKNWESGWNECPDNVNVEELIKYSVDEKNPRVATKISCDYWDYCTIIGNTPLPHNKVTSWSINILKPRNNNGDEIFIGVAPFDIDQDEVNNYSKCGWHFYCYDSTLLSGSPHSYNYKEYGPRKKGG